MQPNRIVRFLLSMFVLLTLSASSFAQIGVSITIAPPALPVYEQPPCPEDGYLWTPGYWAWGDDGYFWVPGTWVLAPEPGFLWTPGYWGWGGAAFIWHEGYWGPTVGFYGGVVYGFGYFGSGFEGGRWDHDHFYYNRSVTNVNVTNIHNVYNTTVINNTTTVNRVSYNGGNGGITARPTAAEEAAANERHVPPVAAQTQHIQEARSNPELRASANQGKPPIAATQKPSEFKGGGVVAAREAGAPYRTPEKQAKGQPAGEARPENARPESKNNEAAKPENRPEANTNETPKPGNAAPRPAVHPNDLPAYERPAAPNTGNPKLDQKYQQQQQKLQAQQEKQRQKLQAQQDKEHAQLAKQNADEARKQQVEQRHQQQTQQLQQRQSAAQQKLMQRQGPPAARPAPERR